MTPKSSRTRSGKTWKEKLTSELAYTILICFTIFLYIILALMALAPNGTVGKLSPIQDAVQRNSYLVKLLNVTGVNHMTNHQMILVFWVLVLLILLAYAWAVLFSALARTKACCRYSPSPCCYAPC